MLDLYLKVPNFASISKLQLSILNNIGTLSSIMSTRTVNFKSRQQCKPKQSFVILHRTIPCKFDGRYFLGSMAKGQSEKQIFSDGKLNNTIWEATIYFYRHL